MEFQQIKTGLHLTTINEDTINLIACVKAFEDVEMNKLLYEHHKNLLRLSMNKNNSNEVGLFWDLKKVEEKPLQLLGEVNGLMMSKSKDVSELVKNPHSYRTVVIMHNHPRNGMFSTKDIDSFCDYNSIYLMTAVCNDGTIYMIRKDANFNRHLLRKYYNEGVAKSIEKAHSEQLSKAKRLKFDINNSEDMEKIKNIPTKPYYYGIHNISQHASEIGITYRCSVKKRVR